MKSFKSLFKKAKPFLALSLLSLIGYFFYKQVKNNFIALDISSIHVNYGYITLGVLIVAICSGLNYLAWYLLISTYVDRQKGLPAMTFVIANISGMVKYLPGALWGYSAQAYLFYKLGISKTGIFNILTTFLLVSISSYALVSGIFWGLSWGFSGFILIGALLVYIFGIIIYFVYQGQIFSLMRRLWYVVTRRKMPESPGYYIKRQIRSSLLFVAIYIVSAFLFGVLAYVAGASIGIAIPTSFLPLLGAAFLIGELGGLVAIFIPGGIGVRESLFYLIVSPFLGGSTALFIPVIARGFTMFSEMFFGGVAMYILFKKKTFQNMKDGSVD
jgi:hypothetical protein